MAVADAIVFPGFLAPVLTQLSIQSHRLLFAHASEVRGENTPKRKLASTGYRTHKHHAMSQAGPRLTFRHIKIGQSIDSCQPTQTAQADMGRYFAQVYMNLAPFFTEKDLLNDLT